jgi:hypothetical protein
MNEDEVRILALSFLVRLFSSLPPIHLHLPYTIIYITLQIIPPETSKSCKIAASQVLYNVANFAALFVHVPSVLQPLCSSSFALAENCPE